MYTVVSYASLVSRSVLSRCWHGDLSLLVLLCVDLVTFSFFLSIYSVGIAVSILTLPACSCLVDSFVVVDSMSSSVSTVGLPGGCYCLLRGFVFGEDLVPVRGNTVNAGLVDCGFEVVFSPLSGSSASAGCWVVVLG